MRSLFNLLAGAVLAVGVTLYGSPEAKACGECEGHHHHHHCAVWWESCTHSHTHYSWCVDPWPTGDIRQVNLCTHYYTHTYPVHGCCR